MIFKQIRLLPTHYWLDFWLFDSKEQGIAEFVKRYGQTYDYYKDWITPNQVAVLTSTKESTANGDTKIVMNISDTIDYVIVHECVHVVFKLGKLTNIEICNKSQEWVAYMTEYIFYEIKKAIGESKEPKDYLDEKYGNVQ